MIDALKDLQRVVQKPLQAPLEFAERASAFSQLLATLEGISPKERRFGGINDWDYTKYLFNSGGGISDAGVREIFVRCLATARIGASVVLLLPTGNNTRLVASSVSALSYLLGNRYTINGSDGAEQYSAIILASSALGRIDGGKNRDLALQRRRHSVTLLPVQSSHWGENGAMVLRLNGWSAPKFMGTEFSTVFCDEIPDWQSRLPIPQWWWKCFSRFYSCIGG